MSSVIRIKRRVSGNPGTPSSLANAELFYNEVEDVLYYGKGTGGSNGTATTIPAIGGQGYVVDKSSAQTIGGLKTFSLAPVIPTSPTSDSSTNAASTGFVNNLLVSLKGAANGLASLAADGTLTQAQIPVVLKGAMKYYGTWDASTNTPTLTSGQGTQGAVYKVTKAGSTSLDSHSTWYVGDSAVFNGTTWDKWDGTDVEVLSVNGQTGAVSLTTDNIVEGAALYFTVNRVLNSIITGVSTATATAIAASDSVLAALGKLQAQVNARLVSSNNLSDLTAVATARTNLGLGTLAIQNASAVAITGGSIDGITLDGGAA